MLKEFREFVNRGNVLDLAVAVVIGAAFGGIIQSFVKDILMPPVGLLLGKVDFSNLFIDLTMGQDGMHYKALADAQKAGQPTLNYGLFLNSIINFLIIAFAVFLAIRVVNRNRPAVTKTCPHCVSTINIKATRCPQCTSQLDEAETVA